jgi:hypothetical protein
MTDIVTLLCDD